MRGLLPPVPFGWERERGHKIKIDSRLFPPLHSGGNGKEGYKTYFEVVGGGEEAVRRERLQPTSVISGKKIKLVSIEFALVWLLVRPPSVVTVE